MNDCQCRDCQRTSGTGHGSYLTFPSLFAESVGLALLVVLEKLAPAERVAFVLHDVFDVPFEEIAPIVGRSPTMARQLASRAGRRVRSQPAVPIAELRRRRGIVVAFLEAVRAGNMDRIVALLDPNIVLRADASAAPGRTPIEVRGSAAVAKGALAFAARTRCQPHASEWRAGNLGRTGGTCAARTDDRHLGRENPSH